MTTQRLHIVHTRVVRIFLVAVFTSLMAVAPVSVSDALSGSTIARIQPCGGTCH